MMRCNGSMLQTRHPRRVFASLETTMLLDHRISPDRAEPCNSVAYGLRSSMLTLSRTDEFSDWLRGLRDERAKARIGIRLDRLALGSPGDVKPVGNGINEMRIDYGPGYRVYFIRRGAEIIALLCGGDKDSQDRDIEQAKFLASSVQGARKE